MKYEKKNYNGMIGTICFWNAVKVRLDKDWLYGTSRTKLSPCTNGFYISSLMFDVLRVVCSHSDRSMAFDQSEPGQEILLILPYMIHDVIIEVLPYLLLLLTGY